MVCHVQGKGKGKGKGKSTKSSEKPAGEVSCDGRKTEVVKLQALDVFAGCGGVQFTVCRCRRRRLFFTSML